VPPNKHAPSTAVEPAAAKSPATPPPPPAEAVLTPLSINLAAQGKLREVCAELDARPSMINATAKGGIFDSRTLIMVAAAKGHTELVRELLRRGADAAAKSNEGDTAASLASKKGHEAVAELLTSGGGGGDAVAAGGGEGGGSGGDSSEPAPAPSAPPRKQSTLNAGAAEFLPGAWMVTSTAQTVSISDPGEQDAMAPTDEVRVRYNG
jgi:hypothetical protein